MQDAHRHFLPAAGRDFLLPLYDPLVRLLGADKARAVLLDQANVGSGERVLDVGCGTGTLLVQLKRRQPGTDAVGLDPDPKALGRAERKARRAGVAIAFERGFADALPYGEHTFDRVFSSLMLHHLAVPDRIAMLREVKRVLKPGGTFHLLDFLERSHVRRGPLARLLHASPSLQDNTDERVRTAIAEAGLIDVRRVDERKLLVGPVGYWRATAP